MSKFATLNKDDLVSILKILNYWDCRSHMNVVFYNKFLAETIKHVPNIEQKIYKDNLASPSNKTIYTSIHNDALKFVEIFENKINLPETFTIFKIASDYCSSTYEKKKYKEFLSFLESKIGKEGMYPLCENYILTYGVKSNSVIFAHWFDIVKSKLKFENFTNIEKIINDYLKIEPNNTVSRNFNLKLLIFLNKHTDNANAISSYVEKHQGDGVFMKGVPKLLSKIKNIKWNESDTPIFNSKKLVGTINFNSEYFIKKYGMTRSESDKFVQLSLSFLYSKLKDLSLNYTSTDLMINADDVNDYVTKEKTVLELFDKIKILAPYWKDIKDKNNGIIFFNNYFEKINTHKELSEEINQNSNTINKQKKIKI